MAKLNQISFGWPASMTISLPFLVLLALTILVTGSRGLVAAIDRDHSSVRPVSPVGPARAVRKKRLRTPCSLNRVGPVPKVGDMLFLLWRTGVSILNSWPS